MKYFHMHILYGLKWSQTFNQCDYNFSPIYAIVDWLHPECVHINLTAIGLTVVSLQNWLAMDATQAWYATGLYWLFVYALCHMYFETHF